MECLRSIWRGVLSDRVRTLELSPRHELCPLQMLGLLQGIVDHPSTQSLRYVTFSRSLDSAVALRPRAYQSLSEAEENMMIEQVRSLVLRLPNIEFLVLRQHTRYLYILPSPAIRHMLQAWPIVKVIDVVSNTPERIPLADFLNLVGDCLLLTSVTGLQVDISIDDILPETRDWQHQHLYNIQFAIGGSSASTENRITLVHLLLTTFPHIASRCIQGDGAMRMFTFQASRARNAGTSWGLDDYQKVFKGTGIADDNLGKQDFTGHYTEDGKPVICYGMLLFASKSLSSTTVLLAKFVKYPIIMPADETTDERKLYLSIGDIIAVTAKHEDGKWTGVLLDEQCHDPTKDSFWGKHVQVF